MGGFVQLCLLQEVQHVMQPWWGSKCCEPGDWGLWCLFYMTKSRADLLVLQLMLVWRIRNWKRMLCLYGGLEVGLLQKEPAISSSISSWVQIMWVSSSMFIAGWRDLWLAYSLQSTLPSHHTLHWPGRLAQVKTTLVSCFLSGMGIFASRGLLRCLWAECAVGV